MAEDAMNVDQYSPNKAQSLYTLTNGPLASSLSKLSGSSRGIPSNKDFYFYNNFDDFRAPIQEIDNKSQSLLESVGSSSSRMWNKHMPFPVDMDEAMDWLNNANDEIFERVDMSIDEFQRNRNSEEAAGKVMNASSSVVDDNDGFQLVCGKKKKGANQLPSGFQDSNSSITVATKDKKTTVGSKPKIPFHIPSITRPQQEFNIFVNNNNQAFEHVWLDKSEDGKYVHPLKKFSFMDFVDKDSDVLHIEPVKPSPVETTPFTFVDEVIDLKNLAIKLSGVNEFAVDLEHNQYRSFQGLTCLIQISTRTEDFVIDALKLRTRIGPYLREAFKDPTKRKVMHGADRDIFWLQRDFGIYICNMFDTGQASRILKLERNSLEYLLHHFCGVTANKEYQNADWRLRPLPKEMLRYAREDTHYLLHIYDLMRMKLLSLSKESESSEISLQEVYKRSYELCIQLYEKEIQNENSYLYIYGLQEAGLNAQQLAVVSGLCGWRDLMARTEDESTGYILPNKTLIEIAKKMPETTSKLRQLVKSKHSFIEQKLGAVVNVVRSNKLKAPEFEAVAEQLKEGRAALASEENVVVDDDPEASEIAIATVESTSDGTVMDNSPSTLLCNGNSGVLKEGLAVSVQREDRNTSTSLPVLPKASAVTVQAQKKPNRAFGALLGSKIPKKKTDLSKKDKEDATLEQIRASVHLPFHSFSSTFEQPKPVVDAPVATLEVPVSDRPANTLPVSSKLDDIIMLQTVNSDAEESKSDSGTTLKDADNNPAVSSSKIDKEEEPMSLSDLSSSFKQCFQDRKTKQVERTQESGGGLKLEPFDYEAARKQVLFGENNTKEHRKSGAGNSKGKKKSDKSRASNNDEELGDFSQGRRRKAFPATGNRSSTFR